MSRFPCGESLAPSTGHRAAIALLAVALGVGALGAGALAAARGGEDDAEARLRAAEAARMPFDEGRVELRIGLARDEGVEWSGTIDLYVERPSRALAIFRSGRQRGRRVLGVGGEVWLLVPGARNPLAVSGHQRLAGTASLADLAGPPLSALYDVAVREGDPDALELTARPGTPAPYAAATLWLDPDTGLPRRAVFRLPSGKEARAVRFTAFREHDGAPVVERMELEDLLGRRERTAVLEFLSYTPEPVPDAWLTLEGARSVP